MQRPIGNSISGSPALRLIGRQSTSGTYLLRMQVNEPLRLVFGRFKRGKLIAVMPGEHIYIGSALATSGATCLARRLVRHATRTGNQPPHAIRDTMVTTFTHVGLACGDLRPRNGKRLRWNIDHLLDQSSVELVGAFLIRSPLRLEAQVGKALENDPATIVFERGLGANDIKGNTHLLRVDADEEWWQQLPRKLRWLLNSRKSAR